MTWFSLYFDSPIEERQICFVLPLISMSAVQVPSASLMILHCIHRYPERCCLVVRSSRLGSLVSLDRLVKDPNPRSLLDRNRRELYMTCRGCWPCRRLFGKFSGPPITGPSGLGGRIGCDDPQQSGPPLWQLGSHPIQEYCMNCIDEQSPIKADRH